MAQKIIQVDSFTDRPFTGNPAAVCLLKRPAEEEWMQQVAAEMNLSETAFLYPDHDGYRLRWFTPAAEVELCGHATLAAAHILWEEKHIQQDQQARFYTQSGLLTAVKDGDLIKMNFPGRLTQSCQAPPELLASLELEASFIGISEYNYLVEVSSESMVRQCRPDFNVMGQLSPDRVIITSRSDSDRYDFVSRFFAPGMGIDEDPVTGAAHCQLAPYWAAKMKKKQFLAYQASQRGGEVHLWLEGDRVILGGKAVTVMHGDLV